MNKEGKNIGYFEFKSTQSKAQPTRNSRAINPSYDEDIHSSKNQSLYAQIDQAAQSLRAKTISLVCQLRKHCLHEQLEGQIQTYLTSVLDQMDLLVSKKEQIQSIKSDKDSTSTFEQIPKPSGDDQYFHAEETVRQSIRMPLQTIHQLSKQATQVELSSKLQSILSEIQSNCDNSYTITNNQKGKHASFSAESQDQEHNNQNRRGIEQKAHRFSNLYIRDINKGKRNKLF